MRTFSQGRIPCGAARRTVPVQAGGGRNSGCGAGVGGSRGTRESGGGHRAGARAASITAWTSWPYTASRRASRLGKCRYMVPWPTRASPAQGVSRQARDRPGGHRPHHGLRHRAALRRRRERDRCPTCPRGRGPGLRRRVPCGRELPMSALFVASPAARQPRSTGRFWLWFHAGGRRARSSVRGDIRVAIRRPRIAGGVASVMGAGSGRPLSPGPAGWFVRLGEGGCRWAFVMGLAGWPVCAEGRACARGRVADNAGWQATADSGGIVRRGTGVVRCPAVRGVPWDRRGDRCRCHADVG